MPQHNTDRQVQSDGAAPYWRLWSACFLGFSAIGMTIQVMPAYAHERLGADAITAGLAVTIGSLATMISRPVSGRFADQSGGRGVAMAGAILALIGGIGHVVATNLPTLILARLFLGAGEGALFTGSVGWILAHTEQSQRGRIAGHFGLSMWMGLASGPLLGTALFAIGTYRDVWIAASIIPMLAWVLVASTRPEGRASSGGTNIRRALFPRAAWVPGASGVFASIGYGIIAAFLVPRFAALDFAGQNFALSVFGIAFMITRFLGSGYADRFGARRVLLSAFLIESVGFAGLFLTHVEWLAFASTALTGAGLSLLIPSVTSLVTEAADPRERTAALGAVTSAWDLGVAVGGPLGGLVAGASNAGPFALGAVAALIAIVPLAINPKRERASRQSPGRKIMQIRALDSRRDVGERADDAVYRFSRAIPRLPGVTAALAYLAPTTERPYNYMYEPPAGTARENCEYRLSPVWITDARAMASPPSIHTEGFELWDAPSTVADFTDEDAIRNRYYAEAAELAKYSTGADHAYIFDHQIRLREAGRPALTFGRHGDGSRPGAAGRIHNDYTETSGQKRFEILPLEERVRASAQRFAIVNIWRSIGGKIVDTPLAVCNACSISAKDLVVADLYYRDRTGELYLVRESPRHRWAYFSEMDRNDVLVFKQYDSQVNGVARFTPHSAFDLPDVSPDEPLRQSIEIRCLVTYG